MTSPPTASFGLSSLGRASAHDASNAAPPTRPALAPDIQAELVRRMATLDGTTMGRSGISAPTSLVPHLDADLARGPDDAYLVGTEFAIFTVTAAAVCT
jgi:hypothetical protein